MLSLRNGINGIRKGSFGKADAFALLLVVAFAIQGATFYLQCHSSRIALFAFLACAVVLALWMWYRFVPFTVEHLCHRVFPIALLVSGVSFALFFAPGTIPDEIYHFKSAYIYSNILSFQADDTMRASDTELIVDEKVVNRDLTVEHWQITGEMLEPMAADVSTVNEYWLVYDKTYEDETVATRFGLPLAQLEIPAALGILLARLLGLGSVVLFYMGRLFNLLYASILIILAVRLTPIGKNAFMALALMPMTLHLIGSYSYDAGIIGMAFLLTALLLRAMRGEGKISRSLCTGIVIVATLLAPCKVIYMTINLIVFFVPNSRFLRSEGALAFKLCVIFVPIIFTLLLKFAFLFALLGSSTGGGSAGSSIEKYSLSYLLGHPRDGFILLVNTFFYCSSNWLLELPGGALGWLDPGAQLPVWLAYFLDLVLLVSCLRSAEDDRVLPVPQRVAFLCLFVLTAIAVVLAMALDWTPVGQSLVQGVQGRYFIPVLLLLLLAIRPKCIQVHCGVGFPLIMFMSGFNMLYLGYIMLRIIAG